MDRLRPVSRQSHAMLIVATHRVVRTVGPHTVRVTASLFQGERVSAFAAGDVCQTRSTGLRVLAIPPMGRPSCGVDRSFVSHRSWNGLTDESGRVGLPPFVAASFHSLPRLVRFRASTAPRYSYPARVAALRFTVLANDVLHLVEPGR